MLTSANLLETIYTFKIHDSISTLIQFDSCTRPLALRRWNDMAVGLVDVARVVLKSLIQDKFYWLNLRPLEAP